MNIYLYGMICGSNSFRINSFPTPDEYTEIQQSYRFPGGETGTCATVLASLGMNVRVDGTHIGRNTRQLVEAFYQGRSVDLGSLTFDDDFEGLEDYILISGDTRTPFGSFGHFFTEAYSGGVKHWNPPKPDDIAACDAAAIDDFFGADSQLAARLCVEMGKPYVTIDCPYDSYVHQHSAVSVISGESLGSLYPGQSREELFPLFARNGGGLTIITNGGRPFCYGRGDGTMKTFQPFKVNVASTLGAGDSFKAGCT